MSTVNLLPDRDKNGSPPFLVARDLPSLPESALIRPKMDDASAKDSLECVRCGEISCRCHLLQYSLYPGLYNPLSAPGLLSSVEPGYRMKNSVDSWRALYQTVSYCSSSSPLGYHPYSDPNLEAASSRRKNATRESTSTLKAWLHEHLKNPYPTKGEKIMLAIITKMTLTQVSTWFANARRRLKKENKMTWSARHRGGEDSDADDEDWKTDSKYPRFETQDEGERNDDEMSKAEADDANFMPLDLQQPQGPSKPRQEPSTGTQNEPKVETSNERKNEPTVKPKIWSLVDTATSASPKPRPQTAAPGYVSMFPAYLSYLLPTYHSFLGPYYKPPTTDMDI